MLAPTDAEPSQEPVYICGRVQKQSRKWNRIMGSVAEPEPEDRNHGIGIDKPQCSRAMSPIANRWTVIEQNDSSASRIDTPFANAPGNLFATFAIALPDVVLLRESIIRIAFSKQRSDDSRAVERPEYGLPDAVRLFQAQRTERNALRGK